MKKVLILYASHKITDPTSQPIRVGDTVLWIRVVEAKSKDLMDALDEATPLPTEMVLNTIYKTVCQERKLL